MKDRRVDDLVSDNERLRQANEALRARMERQAAIAVDPAARAPDAPEGAAWMRRHIGAALEAADAAVALFSEDARLLAVNARFAALFPDIAPRLSPGLRFEEAMRLLSGAAALNLSGAAARAAWSRARIVAHGRGDAVAAGAMIDGRWREISERRTSSGGFALMFGDLAEARPTPVDDALLGAALDQLSVGLGVFDRQGRLAGWSQPFRAMLGLPPDAAIAGADVAAFVGLVVGAGALEPGSGLRRLALWAASTPPRRPLQIDVNRVDGAALSAQARDIGAGERGFALRLSDVTDERRTAAAVERVRRALESRVEERAAALVEVNDRLVQEVAERRAIEAEMRRARDAAEAANLSKTRFLAAASHDLLQPLNAAKLFVSALAASDLPPGDRAVAEKIVSAFGSIDTLLNALLDISKLDAGGGEAQLAEFPVSRILDPLAEEFRPVAAARGLTLRVVRSQAHVRSDLHYLRRIVQNLVSNALRYTRRGGVVVGVRRRAGMAVIEVWDSGIGIPASERRRIFEEFHRLDAANPAGERGMGLGLAIVERASRLLGHAIELRSVEGRGSMFSVSAPLAAPPAASEARSAPSPVPVDAGEAGMIALVVEDDAQVRAATAALLGRWGVDVLEAASGDEAMLAAQQLGLPPDVLLLDYRLSPGETGIDVLRRLRAAFAAPIPAILITADRSRSVMEEAAQAGAQVLTKPVAPAKLRALLHWSRTRQSPPAP